MAEPLGVAAGVIGITSTALHWIRLLLDDVQNLKDAPKTVKRLLDDLRSVETALTALEAVDSREWENLGQNIAEASKLTISLCTKACQQFRIDLERWTKHSQDGKLGKLWDRARVGSFKNSQIKAVSEQLQNCKNTINCTVGTANLYSSIRNTHMTEEIQKIISLRQTEIKGTIASADKQLIVLEHRIEELNLSDEEEAEDIESKAQALQQVEEERSAAGISRKLLDELLSKSQEEAVAKAAAQSKSGSISVTFGKDNSGFQAGTISGGVSNLTLGKK